MKPTMQSDWRRRNVDRLNEALDAAYFEKRWL
ncbi:hypothetical protein J2S03_002190 [Alicyclobacillus cycloheptanicus]|uniref:Uncharacterized protein n=1 Tax=Alicyclobacillus cycloheptanicus TaxID=1457 RepID=A0ABT9XJ54_9BACL|nr:hypothetical protein [Alicyclobacillus cycloheptanicus]